MDSTAESSTCTLLLLIFLKAALSATRPPSEAALAGRDACRARIDATVRARLFSTLKMYETTGKASAEAISKRILDIHDKDERQKAMMEMKRLHQIRFVLFWRGIFGLGRCRQHSLKV